VPIRPFVAEFAAKYAGYTCQQVTHDYEQAFAAVRRCAADFDWDAVVGNMVYVWSGLTEAAGLRYYGVPGIHLDPEVGFQYREPPEHDAFMRPDEYDALIANPTGFLLNVWLPRVSRDVVAPGAPATTRSHLAFLKGGMALLQYFGAFGTQAARLRAESGTVSAIAGILKAPFDILADKLRGYMGLTRDMRTQPEKVLRACEALQPHLLHVAISSADPARQVPIGFWMHRGCVPFVTPLQFESHYWPTLRPATRRCSTPRATGLDTWSVLRSYRRRASCTTWTAAISPPSTRCLGTSSASAADCPTCSCPTARRTRFARLAEASSTRRLAMAAMSSTPAQSFRMTPARRICGP